MKTRLTALALAAGTTAGPLGLGHAAPIESACGDRPSCRVAARWPAGTDGAGRPLTVLRVAIDPRDTGTEAPAAEDECIPYELWLEAGPYARRLLEVCNNGYGAAGMGEDAFEVSDNRLVHHQSGGSSWRWGTERTWSLSPLRLLAEARTGSWTNGHHQEACSFDRVTGHGGCTWWAPTCDADGQPLEAGEEPPASEHFAFVAVPAVTLPAAWHTGAWRTTDLGPCAADPRHPLATAAPPKGEPGTANRPAKHAPPRPATASGLRLLWSEGAFYLEVPVPPPLYPPVVSAPITAARPDTVQAATERPHLELWLGEPADYSAACLTPAAAPPPWRIGLDGDWVLPPPGAEAKSLGVERAQVPATGAATRLRLKVKPPGAVKGATWVHHLPAPDGRTARRQATSALRPEHGDSIGRVPMSGFEPFACVISEGRLEADNRLAPPTPHPVLDAPVAPALADAAGPVTGDAALNGLHWLAGAWQGGSVEEVWLAPQGGLLLGLNRSQPPPPATGIEPPPRNADFEYLRIERTAEGVFYVASPSGGPATRFRLVRAGANEAEFENPAHDFPRRIHYRRSANTLAVEVSGDRAGQPLRQRWTWQRVAGP